MKYISSQQYLNDRIVEEAEKMQVMNASGTSVNFEASVVLMDDEIREELHRAEDWDSEQSFFTAYERRHAEKYGEPWELSKVSPQY